MKLKPKPYRFQTPEGETIDGKILKGYVALFIDKDYWVLAKGYTLFKYNPATSELTYFSRLNDGKAAFLSKFRVSRRLTRSEITHLYHFQGDNWFCIARKTIFKYYPSTGLFETCHTVERGSRPMNLCQDKDGNIYYGEYFFNPQRVPVSIMVTKDNGQTWSKAYTFKDGEINHIHGIYNDEHTGRLWVFTGDDDKACVCGYTIDGFKIFHREFEGLQKYRVCVPIFLKESIVYPTDSQYTLNTIRKIDRRTGEIKDLKKIQGSGIYALNGGNFYAVSTTVEPSKVNIDKFSHLWFSTDAIYWREIVSFPKDMYNANYFQFGSIRFPHYETAIDSLVVTGRAIGTIDQSTLVIPLDNINK